MTTGDGRFLDDRINTLKRDATETTPAQEVYRTASAIMILVRVGTPILLLPVDPHWCHNQNKLSHNKDSVELSEFCSNMCETLKTAMQGKGGDDLSEPASMGLKELERYIDYPSPTTRLYQTSTSGLHPKLSGLSRGGRTHHTPSTIRRK